MKKAVLYLVLSLVIGSFALRQSNAQGCCTTGSSTLGGFESGVQTFHTLSASINYQFNSITSTYRDRDKIDDPLRRSASVGYFAVQLEYGLQPRLSFLAAINYSGKEREIMFNNVITGFDESAGFKGSGVGDITLLAKYQIIKPGLRSPFELSVGGGASLPTGSYTEMQSNNQLSIDLQPGTGAPSLIGWIFTMCSIPESGLTFSLSTQYRYAGTNLDGYRLGDEVLVHVGANYSLNEHFGIGTNLKGRFAQKDYSNRRFLIGTGGTYYDLLPMITYSDGPSTMKVFGQIPLYRNVRGIQLNVSYMIGVEYRHRFDFRTALDIIDSIRDEL